MNTQSTNTPIYRQNRAPLSKKRKIACQQLTAAFFSGRHWLPAPGCWSRVDGC